MTLHLVTAMLWAGLAAEMSPPPLMHFVCRPATGPIVVDGRGDEPAWADTEAITEFRLWETFEKPAVETAVRFCYDDNNLYALFECRDDDLFVLYDERDANIWESDAVELFLKPFETDPIYYEFEVAPNNALFDARMVNSGSGGFPRWKSWNCDIKTAVTIRGTVNEWHDRDQGYTVEMAIPLRAFEETVGSRPLDGQTWRFAAVRVDFSVTLEKEQRSSTANVPDGNIHLKEGYSTLTFLPKE